MQFILVRFCCEILFFSAFSIFFCLFSILILFFFNSSNMNQLLGVFRPRRVILQQVLLDHHIGPS